MENLEAALEFLKEHKHDPCDVCGGHDEECAFLPVKWLGKDNSQFLKTVLQDLNAKNPLDNSRPYIKVCQACLPSIDSRKPEKPKEQPKTVREKLPLLLQTPWQIKDQPALN